ncbi:MAG: UDP-2,3-diacylglucosamine diphosphatase LpxI [Nitrospirae bacterium]|nr:UDP-2,3-diacylglucosamine diphosphatase LpxI [Nitrospirota bacterium]
MSADVTRSVLEHQGRKILGLIAGQGELPLAIAREAHQQGFRVFAIGLAPLCDEALKNHVDDFMSISVGKLGSIIGALKKANVTEAVMGGKVPKTLVYKSKIVPDLKTVGLMMRLKDKSDDSILLAVTEEFVKEGINMLNVTDFTTNLITSHGLLTKKGISKQEEKDIEFGFRIAKEIGRLDIGQTVVIKDRAVIAVEAIEGTDSAIIRAGTLVGDGAVVIKVSKPTQDKRFDYPAAGLQTIKAMIDAKARVLALEADNTLMLDKVNMIKNATAAGITIVGIK